jgi:two-component system, cell cycle response regulator DivK
VDDDVDTREMYASYLRARGLIVHTAANGLQAIDQSEFFRPAAIVMDISMPVLSGEQAICMIKANPSTRSIPIVAITAHGAVAKAKALAAGCDAFCEKPCLPDELAQVVERLTARRKTANRDRQPS